MAKKQTKVHPAKDASEPHPIATVWRDPIRETVRAFAEGDFELTRRVAGVARPPKGAASQIREYIASYGETVVDLPEKAWKTSIAQWMGGHWQLLVDLWTAESGRSDMVLFARVREVDDGYRISIESVHVP